MPLTPVDYDPFEETKQPAQPSETQGLKLVPVDYDPFASEQKEGVLEKAAFTAMKPWATFPEKEQRDFVKGLAKRFYAGALETATSINRLLGFSPGSRLIKPAEREIQRIKRGTQPKSKLEKVGYKFMETLGSLGTTFPLDVMTGGATKLSLGSRVIPRVAEILSRIPDFAVGMGIRGAIAGAKEGETIPERTISALKKGGENLVWGVIYGRLGGRYQIPKFGALGAAEATYQASKEGRLPTKEEIEEGVAHGMALGTLFSMLPWLAKKTQVGIERTILNKAQRNIEKAYREGRFEDIEKEFDALSSNEKLRPEVRQAVKEIKETTLPSKEKPPVKKAERPEAEVVEPERAREAIITAVKRDLARGRDEAGNPFGIDELFALKEHPEIQRLGLDDEINKLIIEEQAKPPPERVNVAELLPKKPVVEPEKKPYREERPVVLGEEEKPPAKEIVAPEGIPAEIARIQAKPAFLRTAEEKLTLERYEKGKKKPKIETAPEERKREIIVPEGEVKREKAREERKVTEEKPPAKEVKEKPKPEKKAKPYEGVEPGSAEWMKIWKEHPELQKEMAEIRQKQIIEEGKKEEILPEMQQQANKLKEEIKNNKKKIEKLTQKINRIDPDKKLRSLPDKQQPKKLKSVIAERALLMDKQEKLFRKLGKVEKEIYESSKKGKADKELIKKVNNIRIDLMEKKLTGEQIYQEIDELYKDLCDYRRDGRPFPNELIEKANKLLTKAKKEKALPEIKPEKEPPKEKPPVVPLTKTLYENSYPIELSKASEEFPEHRLGVDYVVKLVDKNTGKVTWASLSEKRARELFPRSFEEKGKEVAKAETEWQPVKDYNKEITEGTHVKWRYKGKEGEGIATGKIGKRKTGFVYHRVKTPEGKTKYMPWTSRAEYWIKAEKEVKPVKETKEIWKISPKEWWEIRSKIPEEKKYDKGDKSFKVYRGELPTITGVRQLSSIRSPEQVLGWEDKRPVAPFEFFTTSKEDAKHYLKRDFSILENYQKRFGKKEGLKTFEILHGHKPRTEGKLKEITIKPRKILDLTPYGTEISYEELAKLVAKENGIELPKNWSWKDVPKKLIEELDKYGFETHHGDLDKVPIWELFRNNMSIVTAELVKIGQRKLYNEHIKGSLFAQWLHKHGYDAVAMLHDTAKGEPVKHIVMLDPHFIEVMNAVKANKTVPSETLWIYGIKPELVKEAKAEVKEKEPIITQPKENLYEVRHPEKKTWYQIKADPETEQWRVIRFEPYETTYEGKKVTINKGIETKFFKSLEEAKKFAQKGIVEKKPEPEKTIKVHEHGEEYIVRDKDYEETASKTRKEILSDLQGLERVISKPPKFIPVSEKTKPAKEGGGVKTIAEGIRKDLIKTGRVDLRGKEIKHPADLAVVAQVYRDPRFETLRIFYMKGNKIVAHEGITNRMPNFVASELSPKFIWEIKNRMKRLGADGYYLVHNHPSGNPSPSLDDINFTLACADKIPGLKHHIIINSGKYGAIKGNGTTYVLPLPGIPKDWVDPLLSPTKPHGLLGFKIKTEKDLALISRSFKDDSKVVTLIYCSGNKIRLIQEVPARLFTNVEQITNYIRGRVREFGTNHVFAVFSGKYEETKDLYNTSTELIRKNILTDAAFSGTTIRQATNIHAEANEIWGLRQIPEYRLGEPIEEYSKRIAWAKEYLERIKAKEGLKKEVKKEPVITKDIAKKTGEVDKIFTPEEPAAMVRISARRLMAERAREIDAIVEATKTSHEWWDRQPVDKQILYIDKMMKGDTDFSEFGKDSKVVKDMAQQHRALLDKAYEIDKSVNERLDYLENYWPGIWKNREKAEAWIQKKLNTTPGYYKHKFYKLMSDGIKAGLEPITTNPQEMVLWRYFSALHHKMRKDFLNEMKAYELLKFKRGFKKPPKGWVVPKDPSLQVFFRGKEGMVRTGEWIMPKEAANIVDKWLSPSLWSRPDNWGKVFKAFMAVKNPFVAVKLGLSGFHFLNVTLSDLTYNVMRLTNNTLKGNIDVALDRFADILTGPVSSLKLGHKAVELWLGKRSIQTDLDKEIVNYLIRAGARYKLSKAYKIGLEDNWKKAIRDFRKKNIIGGTIKLIPAIAEKIQAPLMEWYVPRLKIGAFLKQAKDFTSAHPEVKGAKLDRALQMIWDSMDNNFGQMVYDNLFWNRTVRDLAVASSLSLSWQLGTIREWGGAGLDIKEAIMKKKMPLWTGRIQFSITYPFVVGMIGGLMCYLFTGNPPQELLDYFYPKTGEKNPDGSDERLQLPAMTKEYWVAKAALEKHGIFKGISTVAWHKLNPVISLTLDLFTNQDYFKTEIRDPNAPLLKQAEQVAVFLGTSGLVPISIANFIRHEKISGEKSILPILGIGVAPRYITRTKIQNEIYNLYSKRFQGIKKRGEKYETNQIKAQLRSLLWIAENHHDPERRKKAWAEFVETLKEVKEKNIVLSKRFWKTIRLAPDIRVFSALNDEDQLDLLLKMTPKELTRYLRYAKRRAKYEFLKRKKTKEIQSFTRPKSTTGLLNYGL